jgi:hypothetical protein
MKANKYQAMAPFVSYSNIMHSAGLNKIVWVTLLLCIFSNGAFAFSIGAKKGLTCGGLTIKPSCTTVKILDSYEEVHQMITRDALSQQDVIYKPSANAGTIGGFGAREIREVQDGNWETDGIQIPALHFDDEYFGRSEQRLERWQSRILAKLKQPTVIKIAEAKVMRHDLGTYLHTLQDFFSHSTWVEAHPTTQDIPKFWMRSENLTPTTTRPCPYEEPVYSQNGIIISYVNNTSLLATDNPLTSGYAGSFGDLATAKAPDGKCAHGLVGNGIHKDWPDRAFHDKARAQAVYATAEATKYIINFSGNNPDNVCMLMTDHPCGTKLTTTVTGNGYVTYSLPTISGKERCDSGTSPCIEFFDISDIGSSVTLTATSDAGYRFSGWTGPDAGSCPAPTSSASEGKCSIPMDGKEKNITATFANSDVPPPPEVVGTWNDQFHDGQPFPVNLSDGRIFYSRQFTFGSDGVFCQIDSLTNGVFNNCGPNPWVLIKTSAYAYTIDWDSPNSWCNFYLTWVKDHWEMNTCNYYPQALKVN